jgi:hypothetical protein
VQLNGGTMLNICEDLGSIPSVKRKKTLIFRLKNTIFIWLNAVIQEVPKQDGG